MSDASADLVLHNARVLTLDNKLPLASMVAIKGSNILTVGSEHEFDSVKGANTKVIDCEGKTVIPGFNDAHCHPISFAMTLLYVDCSPSKVNSISDIKTHISKQARSAASSEWVRAAKYNDTQLAEARHPTRRDLDEAAPDNPVILVHDSGKSCVLNSLALQLIGLTKDTPDPPGGHIGHDANTGELNGIISGRNEYVEQRIPPLGQQELQHGIRLANQDYLSHGITSIQDTTWSNGLRHWKYFQELKESGLLAPRVTMMVGSDAVEEFQQNDLRTGSGDSQLRLGGAKIALDESTGLEHPPQEELNNHVLRAHRAGFQLALHVGHVHNLQTSLASLQFLVQNDPTPYSRPRLEHCAFCPSALVPKLRAFETIVITQPSFLYYLGETYLKEVSAEQLNWLYPMRSFKSQGVVTAISSDSPLFPCNPFIGISAAVTRKEQLGNTIGPHESASALDTLKMHTSWPAYASFEEDSKGSITAGKLADLLVLSDDPTNIEPEGIIDVAVMTTIIDGKVVWER
jgi:predicted amidohydrolase YtcJ